MKQAMLCGFLVVAGCSVQPAEELGTVQQAVGEVACTTAGGFPYSPTGDNGTTTTASISCGNDVTATSPNSSYTNGSSCPKTFIFEERGLSSTGHYSGEAFWAGSARTSSNCSISHLEVAVWASNDGTNWTTKGAGHYDGSWTGTRCEFLLRSGDSGIAFNWTGYTIARTVATAYTLNSGFFLYVPVTAGIVRPISC